MAVANETFHVKSFDASFAFDVVDVDSGKMRQQRSQRRDCSLHLNFQTGEKKREISFLSDFFKKTTG